MLPISSLPDVGRFQSDYGRFWKWDNPQSLFYPCYKVITERFSGYMNGIPINFRPRQPAPSAGTILRKVAADLNADLQSTQIHGKIVAQYDTPSQLYVGRIELENVNNLIRPLRRTRFFYKPTGKPGRKLSLRYTVALLPDKGASRMTLRTESALRPYFMMHHFGLWDYLRSY